MNRSLHAAARIWKVYREALTMFISIQSRWSQPQLTLSRLHPWNQLPLGECGVKCTFRGQGRGEEPPIARVQLEGQPTVTSSQWPPPTLPHYPEIKFVDNIIFPLHITSKISVGKLSGGKQPGLEEEESSSMWGAAGVGSAWLRRWLLWLGDWLLTRWLRK